MNEIRSQADKICNVHMSFSALRLLVWQYHSWSQWFLWTSGIHSSSHFGAFRLHRTNHWIQL